MIFKIVPFIRLEAIIHLLNLRNEYLFFYKNKKEEEANFNSISLQKKYELQFVFNLFTYNFEQ